MPNLWSAETGRYLRPNGTPIPDAEVRAGLRQIVSDSADRLQVLTERFQAGRLDLVGWREAMRAELRTSVGTAASLANGGLQQMGPSQRGVLSGLLRQQYGYLDVFSLDMSQGRVTDAQMLARARQYAGAATPAFETFRRRGAQGRGHTEEANQLGAADHCPDCLAETARGFVPLGSLSLPGTRQCLGNCSCSITTRRVPVAAEEAA